MTAGHLDSPLLGRLVRPADYVRVLATSLRLRSPHFAVHHVEGRPLPLKKPSSAPAKAQQAVGGFATTPDDDPPVDGSLSTELSTGGLSASCDAVDDSACKPGQPQRWLGLVVPKRHAKRAVTRTLVKRQIRNVVAACAGGLAPGLWVVRQRSPFDPKLFPSAASDALKEATRAELHALFERAVNGERDRVKPRSPPALNARSSSKSSTPSSTSSSTP